MSSAAAPRRGLAAAVAVSFAFLCFLAIGPVAAETFQVAGSLGKPGISLQAQGPSGIEIHYEIGTYGIEPIDIAGQTAQKISLLGVMLPNNAGAPDLPGMGRHVAVPEGARAQVRIVSASIETIRGIEISPAPVIPKETDTGPLVYSRDPAIWGRDAFYPESPVMVSEPGEMRGVDMVTVGITPFQYNPVTKELKIYHELDVQVDFVGGTGVFGENRLRSRWWEPILAQHLINYQSLPSIDFESPRGDRDGFEYIIISPTDPAFTAWADTLKNWRKLQGISTEVFTTAETGTTAAQIESFLNNAYNTWDPAPAAFLCLGDFPGSGLRDTGITSPIWTGYCVSDNMYADVDADDMPDMFHARIVARNAAELQTMIGKGLAYERTPSMDPDMYDHPLIAGGWQTERWFIICCEIFYGHQANVLGKHPVREYAIYQGTPGQSWSSNPNTHYLVEYFGPGGLGYIPSTPQHLTDWGGNATRINADLNDGAYLLLHRDHGMETGWGEPSYTNANLSGLHNDNLPFVMSMNCLTGKYNWSSQCFTEAFHRMAQGAVGLIAASEISYSFVNDCYIFGILDTMWPEFMPDYGPYPPNHHFLTDLMPAMGQASGKYFLQASNWPYNPGDKDVTYHLFHHHGDAFLPLYSEVPTPLTVQYDPVLFIGMPTFRITADEGALIGLTVDNEIIGVAQATGLPQEIPITVQTAPGELRITVTRANKLRYDQRIPVLPPTGPYLAFDHCFVYDETGDRDGIPDAAEEIGLEICLENVGVDPTTNVTATLASNDPYVEILEGTRAFPDIPAGAQGTCMEPFLVRISGDVPDLRNLAFTASITANEGSWEANFSLPSQAPVFTFAGPVVMDLPGGNGNGLPEPGETILMQAYLGNTGHSNGREIVATLSTTDPHVVVLDATGECPGVPVAGQGITGAFQLLIQPTHPMPGTIPFTLALSGPGGLSQEVAGSIDLRTYPFADDVEAERGWTLGAPGDNASSGMWVRVDPNGTTYNGQQAQTENDHTTDPAAMCFVTGQGSVGGAAGEADVDNGKTTLLTPVFRLGNATSASVRYWRWYTNNLGNNPGADYWDVDVTNDGSNWVHLEHTTASANSWNEYTFDLMGFVALSNDIQLRFVADDTAPGSLVEAGVDDFQLDATFVVPTGAPDEAVTRPSGLLSYGPNPIRGPSTISYSLGRSGPVRLDIYDVMGRRVRSLVDGDMQAGAHESVFDGLDQAGRALPSGIYFLSLETKEALQVRQLTILR